jgi:hypothetical protein
VNEARLKPVIPQDRQSIFKALHLAHCVFVVQYFRRCEVRAHSLETQVPARGQHFAQTRQRILRRAQAVHARVDLQMHRQTMRRHLRRTIALSFSRRPFQRLNVPWFPDRRREIMGDDSIFLALPDSSHQQDTGRNAGSAQRQTLRGIGHSQPVGALGFERPRTFHRAVAVTVGFDHCANGDIFADVLLHRVEIFSQCS